MTDKPIVEISVQDTIYIVSFNQAAIAGVSQVEEIAHTLRALIRDRRPAHLIIDFSSVVFFSSQMLGVLVDLWRRMKDTGGQLKISGINPQLTRVFRITHLDRIFEFYDDPKSAAAAINPS